jgi:hypothetical protein
MIPDDVFLPDPVLRAGKVYYKCPACSTVINVPQNQVDPLVGLNVVCPECKLISHLPGAFHAEPVPPAYLIARGVQVHIDGFADWYYDNPAINKILQTAQTELLENYGLWGFCASCRHPFPAALLNSLAIDQSVAPGGGSGILLSARTADPGTDMQALRTGHCPQCGHTELVVISCAIPDALRDGSQPVEKGPLLLTASKTPFQKSEATPAKGGKLGVLAILAAVCALGLLVWVMLAHPDLSFLAKLKVPLAPPVPTSTLTPLPPTPTLPPSATPPGGVCWTRPLTGFAGTRSEAWEKAMDDNSRKLLTYEQFLLDVITHNPQLQADGFAFLEEKSYLLPELCP